MCTTPVSVPTRTGTLLFADPPLPSWPLVSIPHAQTVPSDFSARLRSRPPLISTTSVRFFTATGLLRGLVVPSPSWPLAFIPQARTVPSAMSASEW